MSKSIQAKLTMNEEEIEVLKNALLTMECKCDEQIEIGANFPESEQLTRYAENAREIRTKVIALYDKLLDAYYDGKYR